MAHFRSLGGAEVMNNEQPDGSDAELYNGSLGGAFALIVVIVAAAVLWLF